MNGPALLIGVPSHGAEVPYSRRQSIRSLSGARDSLRLLLRFVLADDQQDLPDLAAGDLWQFKLPPNRRARKNYGLEKWLLCDAFMRRAVRTAVPGISPSRFYDFIALADDDTLYHAPSLVCLSTHQPV